MNLRKGDNVMMLQGKDRGKQGKILLVRRSLEEGGQTFVVVEGLNTVKRHQKPRQQGQKGQILSKERGVNSSNVQLVCPKCGKPTRVSNKIVGDTKIRVCKKCEAEV